MLQLLNTIISVALGALVTWYLSRRRPTHVPFEILGTTGIILKLPETKITYRNIALEELYVTRIRAYNDGSQVIENNAKFIIEVSEDSTILGATAEIFPERKDAECRTKIYTGRVEIVVNKLFPYALHHEELIINIFSDSKVMIKRVEGSGVFRDGTAWGASSPKNPKEKWIPGVGYLVSPTTRRESVLLLVTVAAFLGMLAIMLMSFLFHPPSDVINFTALQLWFNNYWAWLMLGSLVGFLFWSIAMGFHGWRLRIPIPFTGHSVDIKFVKVHKFKNSN